MALRAINTIGDSVNEKPPKKEGILKVVRNDSETELPPDAIELKISEVLRIKDPNGLPATLVILENGEAFYVNAPPEHVGAFFEAPQERRLSLGSRLAFAACLGLTAAGAVGCNTNSSTDHSNGSSSDQALSQMQFALQQASDADHFGPLQQAAFTLDGDKRPVIGDFNGQTVISFIRQDGAIQHCYYVKADTIEQALATPNATMIGLIGPDGQPNDASVESCIFDGDKIYYQRGVEVTGIANVVQNGDNLIAQNQQPLEDVVLGDSEIGASTMKLIEEGGVKYLVWDNVKIHKLNLTTGEVIITSADETNCELPYRDPQSGLWIGSKFGNYGGPVHCRVVKANTLPELQASMQYIPGLLTQPGVGVTGEGKNAEIQGEVMTLEVRMKDPVTGELLPSKIYYAIVVEYCGNNQCGEGETNASCPGDCPVVPPVDAGTQDAGNPDAGQPDAGQDIVPDAGTQPDPDAGTPPDQDAGNPPDLDAGPDISQDAGPDTGPDAGPDIPIPPPQEICTDGVDNDLDGKTDCLDPDCFPKIIKISWIEGQNTCAVPACETTADYETADIEGQCTFSVDLGGANPVILTIEGKYSVDFLNKMGELLLGKYKVVDNGNNFGTVFSNSVTGVSGTTYEGMETVIEGSDHKAYHLKCIDGKITLSIDGVVIATLEAEEEGTYDLEDPHPQVEDAGTDEDAEGSDGGDSDTGSGTDIGDKDAGTTEIIDGGTPDTSKDATSTNPDAKTPTVEGGNGGGGGGCSATPGAAPKGSSTAEQLAAFGMLLTLVAATMRRQNRTQRLQRTIDGRETPDQSPYMPGQILVETIREKVAGLWGRIKGKVKEEIAEARRDLDEFLKTEE